MSFLEEGAFEFEKEMHFTAEGMQMLQQELIRQKHRETLLR